jgi:hypothetical protein
VDETWDEPFDVKVSLENGGSKSIQTRRHHKLTAVKNGFATIEVTYQVLSPIDAFAESQLVQRLMEGEVEFDIEAGRVVSQQMDVDKRILGFAGPTSSLHYVMRMEEKLASVEQADEPQKLSTEQPFAPSKTMTKADQSRPPTTNRSSSRPRATQGRKGYRR